MSNSNYTDVLLEDMNAKFDAIIEAIEPMGRIMRDVAATQADMLEVKQDIKVIKAAVTDQSRQLQDHETRITALESA